MTGMMLVIIIPAFMVGWIFGARWQRLKRKVTDTIKR